MSPLLAQAPAFKAGDALFVTERVSVMTDGGITSLVPGDKVKVLSQSPKGLKVSTADGTAVDLKPTQVTKDTNLASSLAQQHAQAQAALMGNAQAEAERIAISRARAMGSIQEKSANAAPATVVPAPSEPLHGSALDLPATKAPYKVIRPQKQDKQDPNSQRR